MKCVEELGRENAMNYGISNNTEKFKGVWVDLSLLKYEAPRGLWNHFLEITDDPPQTKFHESL